MKGFAPPIVVLTLAVLTAPIFAYFASQNVHQPKVQEQTFGAQPAITTFAGGTGSTSPSGILYGDETIRLKTVKIGSNLTFAAGILSATGGASSTLLADFNTFTGDNIFGRATTTSLTTTNIWGTTNGGSLTIDTLDAITSGTSGGGLTLSAGNGVGLGVGGAVSLTAGDGGASGSSGGDVSILAGRGRGSEIGTKGGDLILGAGDGTGGSGQGDLKVRNPVSTSFYAILNVDALTSTSRTITFPDADGTLCLRETCTTFAYPFPSDATSTLINFSTGLRSASTTLTGPFAFGNATGTNATTTNFFATLASSTNLYGANLFECSDAGDTLNWNNGLFSCGTDATAAGGADPFTWSENYGVTNAATTTNPIWATLGINASSSSHFVYASTTQFQIGSDYITDLSTGLSISAAGAVTVTDVTCTDCLSTTETDSTIAIAARNLTIAGTANQITSSAGAQDLSADRTWTLSLPSHVIFPGNYQATNATTTNATTTSLYVGSLTGPLHAVAGQVLASSSLSNAFIEDALTVSSSGSVDWTALTNYATGCTNQFVRTIGDTLTCASINNGDWSGTDLSVANGGTGLSTFGGSNTVLYTTAADTLASEAAFTYNASTDVLTTVAASTTNFTIDTWFKIPAVAAFTSTIAGAFGLDTTQNQLKVGTGSNSRVYATDEKPLSVAYASTTQGAGTTTLYIGPAPFAQTFSTVQCDFSNFMGVSLYDGTNRSTYFVASSTIGTTTLASNNTFNMGEVRRIDIGTSTDIAAAVRGGCTFKYRIDPT